MLETICTPYGKAAFPTVVKCDGCGESIIDNGWSAYPDDSKEILHFCDGCEPRDIPHRHEFRICRRCGTLMDSGFTDEGNEMGYSFLCCEDCFEQEMAERFGEYRACDDGDGCGGYYEWYEPREQEWCGTGIYWTQWN